jgi:hypothetical protein
MARRDLKKEKPVFSSTRKPTAPPSKKMGPEKPPAKAHPAGRKSKHKPKDERQD